MRFWSWKRKKEQVREVQRTSLNEDETVEARKGGERGGDVANLMIRDVESEVDEVFRESWLDQEGFLLISNADAGGRRTQRR